MSTSCRVYVIALSGGGEGVVYVLGEHEKNHVTKKRARFATSLKREGTGDGGRKQHPVRHVRTTAVTTTTGPLYTSFACGCIFSSRPLGYKCTSFVSLMLLNTRADGSVPARITRVPESTSSAGDGQSSPSLWTGQHGADGTWYSCSRKCVAIERASVCAFNILYIYIYIYIYSIVISV